MIYLQYRSVSRRPVLFPCVELGKTAVVVVAQTPEVVEGDPLQVGPGESVRQRRESPRSSNCSAEIRPALYPFSSMPARGMKLARTNNNKVLTGPSFWSRRSERVLYHSHRL